VPKGLQSGSLNFSLVHSLPAAEARLAPLTAELSSDNNKQAARPRWNQLEFES
jgi:hypothetical protein